MSRLSAPWKAIGLFASVWLLAAAAFSIPRLEAAGPFSDRERGHWAFQPVTRPPVPAARHAELVRNPIDAFLLDRLEAAGLTLAAPASRRDLFRRAKLDLLGLPPTPEEMDDFLADDSPDAYERRIDGWLASPHYGEHWGRMWLDVVRYAETAGYNADPFRPNAWKYRDYVIASFNADKPFDRFLDEQIAGDELFPDDPDAVIGSGYTLLWPDESNASNIPLARQDALNDLTANVGAAFLGLSLGCAQCHDHKFDPLPQADFYRLQAFFAGLIRRDEAAIGTTDQLVAYRQELDRWLADSAAPRNELHDLELPARRKAAGERRMRFPPLILEVLDTLPEKRTVYQRQLAFWSERQLEIKEADIAANLTPEQRDRRSELKRALADWESRRPKPPAHLAGMLAGEAEAVPPQTFLLAAGSYDKPVTEVEPGFLSILSTSENTTAAIAAPHPHTSGRRSALAHWLSDPRNPLVPRVIVNRIWQGHFGLGLVENANDFGFQTAPPTHPDLLNWLTAEFLAGSPSDAALAEPQPAGSLGPWSLKRLHRQIMTSAAYRQSTERAAGAPEGADPGNRLYGHFPRRRLSAESLRDALLAVSGRLNRTLSGPSVLPELPKDFNKREAWKVSTDAAARCRRSIYILSKRNLPYPLLEVFDLPDMHESCARRSETTVAPQALMLLNSELILDYAQSFAGRLLLENPQAEFDRVIRDAYRIAFAREVTDDERALSAAFLEHQQSLAAARIADGQPLLIPHSFPKFLDPPRAAALVDFCHALLNTSEFLYVD
jgi:hypothetical protein